MRKYTVPLILSVTIVIAGVFALIPVDQATAVHTQIQANTEKLDEGTSTSTTAGNDFTITCPTASDGCYIIDVYLIENDGGGEDVDIGAITAVINGNNIVLAADGSNTDNTSGGAIALSGPSGIGLGPDDTITIDIEGTTDSNNYTLNVIAMVEGLTAVEVTNA